MIEIIIYILCSIIGLIAGILGYYYCKKYDNELLDLNLNLINV
jgi:hypothetical protein